ncbi:MFS transporter [Spirillospora sp. NPDC047279]|uniref:MFS transporter n=1 Tax=Spirillospora sp. NPDC047279 TaxID=3155478 RepID=UPI0033E8A835
MARKWWTLVAVVVGVFMLLLDVTIVNVALPDIQNSFDASLADLQWVLDAYALALAAGLLTAGTLADRLGRRRLFAAGTAIFTAGSLLCGTATGPMFLNLARAGQGIGGAIMFATSLALLSNAFRGKDRGVAFGVFGAVTGIAVAVGPVLGGVITTGLSWRWIFLVNIPIGIGAVLVTLLKVDESRDPNAARTDWAGLVTFTGGLAALVYGLIESAEGWTEPRTVISLSAAAVLLVAFGIAEAVQRRPMLDFALLRKPTFTGGLIAAFGISASLFSLLTYVVLYLQVQLGHSAMETGLRTLFLTGAIFLTAGIAGRLTTVVPVRAMISLGFLLIGIGLLLMRGLTPASDWTHLIPGLVLAGIGAGLVNVPLASTAVGVVEPARSGMASGINTTFRQVGIATGIAALGSLFAGRLRDTVTDRLLDSPLAAQAHQIADGVGAGSGAAGTGNQIVVSAAQAGFVDGLNLILLVGAVVALFSAASSLLLIRGRDFVDQTGPAPAVSKPEPAHAA